MSANSGNAPAMRLVAIDDDPKNLKFVNASPKYDSWFGSFDSGKKIARRPDLFGALAAILM